MEIYRGAEYAVNFLPKVRIELGVVVRAGRSGRRRADRRRPHRPDRRRQDLRHADRAGGAHPHRRDRRRRALSDLRKTIQNIPGGIEMTQARTLPCAPCCRDGRAVDDRHRYIGLRTSSRAGQHHRQGRHRLDDRRHRPGADDDHPGPRAFLCRHGAQEERARHHGAVAVGDVSGFDTVGGGRLQPRPSPATAPTSARSIALFLNGITLESVSPLAKNIPESLFMLYQMTFAVITVALVAGSVADRIRFSAFLWFSVFWLFLVYVPIAHWVWGGGFLGAMAPSISPADLSCISMPASPVWSRPSWSASAAATAARICRRTICRWR